MIKYNIMIKQSMKCVYYLYAMSADASNDLSGDYVSAKSASCLRSEKVSKSPELTQI